MYTVDVIIPTYKPGREFLQVLDMLAKQTVKPSHVIIMNTEEKYFERLIFGSDFLKKYRFCRIYHHSKKEFDHGATRNRGVKLSNADYFVMMTQDAVPADNKLLERLLEPLASKKAAVSYAKQLPKEDCSPVERFTRSFNYPENSCLKGEKDKEKLGIKTYFCSDVCAAYDKQVFVSLGGFVGRAIFNEDMIYAAKAAKAGHMIAYCAEACVYHSHNYSPGQQFHRNFDLGVSQADHPEVFSEFTSEKEGVRMVKETFAYLWNNGYKRMIPGFFMVSASKWLGFKLGSSYQKLPDKLVFRFSADPSYWKRKALRRDAGRAGKNR